MLNKIVKISILTMSLITATNSLASDKEISRSDFYNKMQSIINEKPKVLLINSPEEYIYNLSTTDFIKGLMNQYAGLTRIIASTENKSSLDEINKDLFLNIICAQAALGNEGKEHYETIEKLSIQGLDINTFNKNIEHLMKKSDNLRGIIEVPITIKQCKKEGDLANEYTNAVNLIRDARK